MTIINNKKDEIQIIIRSTSPEEEKDIILKALVACVRWYGYINYSDLKNANNEDSQNLVVVSNLIKDMVDTKVID